MTNNVTVKLTLQTTDARNNLQLFNALANSLDFAACLNAHNIEWAGYNVQLNGLDVEQANKKLQLTYDVRECDFSLATLEALEKQGFVVVAEYYDECDSCAGVYAAGQHIETAHWRAFYYYEQAHNGLAHA